MLSLNAITSGSRDLANFQDIEVYGDPSSRSDGEYQMLVLSATGVLSSATSTPTDATAEFVLVDTATNTRLKTLTATLETTGIQNVASGAAADAEDDVALLDVSFPNDARGYLDLLGMQCKNKGSGANSGDIVWKANVITMGGYKSITILYQPARRV